MFSQTSLQYCHINRKTMLKVDIWPAFLNQCLFELKEDQGNWTFILAKDGRKEMHDPGAIWHRELEASGAAESIIGLAKGIIETPTPDERIILDGVSVRFSLHENGSEREHTFRCPFQGSPELQMIRELVDLAIAEIDDPDLHDYLELLEGYFFEDVSIRKFPGDPFRLKLTGSLTSDDMKELKQCFKDLKTAPNPMLDMSNFERLGRILDPLFRDLSKTPGLLVYANAHARSYLIAMGFDPARIHLGRPPHQVEGEKS
jgi:hypothetical protein